MTASETESFFFQSQNSSIKWATFLQTLYQQAMTLSWGNDYSYEGEGIWTKFKVYRYLALISVETESLNVFKKIWLLALVHSLFP